jgi:hypothetical protein
MRLGWMVAEVRGRCRLRDHPRLKVSPAFARTGRALPLAGERSALDHLPSGRFGANGAWLGFNVIAHNLVRWLSRVGLEETLVTTTTVRTRHVAIPGWVVGHARQLHLHLPARWPWAQQFLAGLERLRSLPVALSTPA